MESNWVLFVTLGITLGFFIARHFAQDWVKQKAGPELTGLLNGVEASGWRFIAIVRLTPIFPFSSFNDVLGLTSTP